MCGITAILSLTGRPIADAAPRIRRMTACLRHRGPDRTGTSVSEDGLVALGNTRLSVVDVGNDFAVPLRDIEGRSWIAYNGEIFDHLNHRSAIESAGYRFATRSDTEVVLRGVSLHGLPFLERLDGFWSFVHYTPESRTVIAARDVLGEKHLFYRIHCGELLMASEIPPLLTIGAHAIDYDLEGVASAFQYRAAPPGRTLFSGIHRFRAGEALTFEAGTDRLSFSHPVRLHPSRHAELFAREPDEAELIELFDDQVRKACRLRVPSEVDYLTTLSGGIDSTLVNVYASEQTTDPLHSIFGQSTSTPPRKGNDLDEWETSCFTAGKLGNRHERIDLIGDDAADIYAEQAANAFDGLFCEGGPAYRQLARHVRESGGRVLIMSDGPDELIGGYDVDIAAFRRQQQLAPATLRRQLLKTLAGSPAGRRLLPEVHRSGIVNWANLNETPFHFRPAHGGTTPEVMAEMFAPELAGPALMAFGDIPAGNEDEVDGLDLSQRMALSYATNSLPDYYNLRSDRASMAESIELRLPFQSRRLVELMIATPAKWRFKSNLWTKYLLRRLVQRHIGDEVAYRGKYGFAHPAWLVPKIAAKLDMPGVISDSQIFAALPFRPGAKAFVLARGQERIRWMAYCLAKVDQRLRDITADNRIAEVAE